jgi:glycyl-tRNA synthetase beta chain
MAKDFLVEIGTEELPPKTLKQLAADFHGLLINNLQTEYIPVSDTVSIYASPRRLAILISNLSETTPGASAENWGPPIAIAFDANNKPTKAGEAFATKNNLDTSQLHTCVKNDGKQDRLFCVTKSTDIFTIDHLAHVVSHALECLPVAKRMRWGKHKAEFVRPVHWLVMLFGDEVIDCEIMGLKAGRVTYGHRVHSSGPLEIKNPSDYEALLEKNFVMADFAKRRDLIRKQVNACAETLGGKAVIDDELLDEVTALVEWPAALAGNFEQRFLSVPQEALIASMSEHQKYFHVVDKNSQLMSHFITVANLESLDPAQVIAGNEKVIRPRLADAAFFFEQDKKDSLESRLEKLKSVVFQEKLGSIYDKCQRVSRIAAHIAAQAGINKEAAFRAGLLCKADLNSSMVLEFDNMQGIAGHYYAEHDGEAAEVGLAIREHYLPKQAGGELPSSPVGAAVALADRLDTLIGIFGVGESPSGSKDPFALRRAAIGVLNIILGHKLDLGLYELLAFSENQHREQHHGLTVSERLVEQVLDYIMERFRASCLEQGISTEVFNSVAAKKLGNALDFSYRIEAVSSFAQLPQAQSLAAANKRVGNILTKSKIDVRSIGEVKTDLLRQKEEQRLFQLLQELDKQVRPLINRQQYTEALKNLASLRETVDAFFDAIMVNVEEEALRNNRLALLARLQKLFLSIADISCLVPEKN